MKKFYQHAYEQKFDSDKESKDMQCNSNKFLASARDNFPILNDLLGRVEPEILTFFDLCQFSFKKSTLC